MPKPYSGKMTVFRPCAAYLGYEDSQLGWGKVCDKVEICTLPVYPAGMLVEPYAEDLARVFHQYLEKAQN